MKKKKWVLEIGEDPNPPWEMREKGDQHERLKIGGCFLGGCEMR